MIFAVAGTLLDGFWNALRALSIAYRQGSFRWNNAFSPAMGTTDSQSIEKAKPDGNYETHWPEQARPTTPGRTAGVDDEKTSCCVPSMQRAAS